MRNRYFMPTLVCVGLLLVVIACSVPLPDIPTATQKPTATTTPAPTASPAATATLNTPPTEPSIAVYSPSEARTGIQEVDAVIAAVLSGDLAARRALVQFLTYTCTTAQGNGGPPKCATGEKEGTQVEVFPILGEEGEFARLDTLDAFLGFKVIGLYAVYVVPSDAYQESYWPAGQYGLVFLGNGIHTSVTVLVQDAVIVRLNLSRRSPAEELALSKGRVILPPPN